MKTQKQAIDWINKSIGKQYDFDLYFGAQCFDYANAYYSFVTGKKLYGQGAKDIPFANDFTNTATVHKNTLSFLAKAGDIVVWGSEFGKGFGHVAVVIEANLEHMYVVEQNWLNGGWTQGNAKGGTGWETATKRKHNYETEMWFIRPKFKQSIIEKAKDKVAKKPRASKAKKILLVAGHGYNDSGAVGNNTNERDFIRENIVPKVSKYLKEAGHVVYTYGGSKMDQDLFQDTRYGVNIGDTKNYGMYWVAQQKYDIVVEFHLDASTNTKVSGGHVIIANGLEADAIDIGLQQALRKSVGLIREIDKRDNLLNVNVAKELNINYRLVELGFITSAKDMKYIKSNLNSYCKKIAEAINGKEIKSKAKASSKSKQVTHTVKAGDSLYSIAKHYKTTVADIKKLNNIKSNLIVINKKLIIKK